MNIQELNCPACKEQYSELNPPRLLTMCGHTFCHKCIKTLITKIKDKGFRVKCPIDKGCMQMEKPNPNLFPKNIALINMLNKKKCDFISNEFLDVQMVQKGLQILDKNATIQQNCTPQKQIHQDSCQHQVNKMCLLHNKLLDVYCIQDCKIICTDCALFSYHRNHEIKNLAELLTIQSQKINQLLIIMKQKQQAENKFLSKEIQFQIFDILDKKKTIIQNQITQFFIDIKMLLQQKQKSIKQDLQTKSLIVAQKIRDQMKIEKKTLQKYHIWQNQVGQMIHHDLYNSQQGISVRLDKLIKNNFYENQIKNGKLILQKISSQQVKFMQTVQKQLDCMQFTGQKKDIQFMLNKISMKYLNENKVYENNDMDQKQLFGKIFKLKNQISFNQFSNQITQNGFKLNQYKYQQNQLKKINYQKQNIPIQFDHNEEQSLLDFNTSFQPKPLKESSFSCNNISVLSINSASNHYKSKKQGVSQLKKKSQIIKKIDSSQISIQRKRTLSITLSSPSLRSSNNIQKSPLNKTKKNDSYFRYQALIDDIMENKSDTIDLTGAELRNEDMLTILYAINRSESIKTVKLMRNKLDDEFIGKYMKYLLKIERINLAQNKLSQQSVDKLLQILKENPNHKVKYINLGQNRIVQRKNRKILDEFKKTCINIVL